MNFADVINPSTKSHCYKKLRCVERQDSQLYDQSAANQPQWFAVSNVVALLKLSQFKQLASTKRAGRSIDSLHTITRKCFLSDSKLA